MMSNVTPEVKQALDGCGLPYSLEMGKRHIHVKLMGRLVGVLPRGKTNGAIYNHANKNVVSQIKRAAARLKEDPTWVGRV